MHRHKFSCPQINFSEIFSRPFQEWSRVSYKGGSLRCLSLLIRFLLQSLVSSSFLVHLKDFFFNFTFISTWLIMFAANIHKYFLSFPFLLVIGFFLGISIPSVISLSPLLIISMTRFSKPISIHISWLYILIVCIIVYSLFLPTACPYTLYA